MSETVMRDTGSVNGLGGKQQSTKLLELRAVVSPESQFSHGIRPDFSRFAR